MKPDSSEITILDAVKLLVGENNVLRGPSGSRPTRRSQMGKPADRDPSYMRQAHGTTKLITDYGSVEIRLPCPDPSNLRNSEDYDDWEYGTEPIPRDHTWTRKRSR